MIKLQCKLPQALISRGLVNVLIVGEGMVTILPFSYFNTPPKIKRLTKYLHTPPIRVGPIIMPFKIKRRMLWFHDNEKDVKPEIILYPVYKHVTEIIEISD